MARRPALVILIGVDRRIEPQWGVGRKSRRSQSPRSSRPGEVKFRRRPSARGGGYTLVEILTVLLISVS